MVKPHPLAPLKPPGSSPSWPVFPWLLAALLLPALTAGLHGAPNEAVGYPVISTYSSSEIGGDAQSYGTTQHPSGVLFFGGSTLLSFDGERWTSTALAGAYGIRGLDVGPDGRLWVGAVGELGWFTEPTTPNRRFTSLRPHLPSQAGPLGQVWRVFADEAGAIFVTGNQILRWRDHRLQVWPLRSERRLLAMRVNGTVYVDDQSTGVHAIRADGPQLFIPRAVLGEARVFWMDARRDGWLLATQRGLFLLNEGKLVRFADQGSALVAANSLTCGVQLADGRYAFGTSRGGIIVMRRDGTLDHHWQDDVLPTRSISSLYVDRDGDLWATSASAIFRVDVNSSTVVFDDRAGLPAQSYRSIAKHGNQFVFGSERGLYELAAGQQRFALSDTVREHVHDVRLVGDRLIATGLGWAREIPDGGGAVPVHHTGVDVFTVADSRRHPGSLYFSEARSIVSRTPDGVVRIVVQDLPEIVRSIAEDDAGNLWLATITEGILFATPDAVTAVRAGPVPAAYGLPSLQGRSLLRMDSAGTILALADNGGWIKPAGEARFRPIEHYPARSITAATEIAGDGTAWVAYPSTDRLAACVARIRIHGSTAIWEPHSVRGLPEIGLPRSILAETGPDTKPVLWIGGTRSVLRHVVTEGPVTPRPRPPVLQVFAFQAENDSPHLIRAPLSYSTQRVEFQFAAPEFARRGSLRLETRIAGIDQGWAATASGGTRELTALRDGQYSFQVRTLAESGIASEPTTFKFEVLPPFWRTPGFLVAITLALLPLGYGSYLLRVRRLRRRNLQLEAKVRERTEELVKANAAKTQFVANISHDIRNPLNGIVGLALALEDTRLDRRQTELVATLRECTTYLSSLVDDVLDFASIEAGRVELRPARYAPLELLRSITEMMKAETAASGATLTLAADPQLPSHLEGDTGRIQQILVNFVSNALKYAGGEIRLSVTLPEDSPGEVEFAVTDRGPGIAREEQGQLFTKFTRLRPTHGGERIPGTGLGLAACRLLADIMGGSVGLHSSAGDGAQFFLRLPLAVASAQLEPAPDDLPNTSVLLVEDTDYNAWAASAVLAKLGLGCDRARTGAEALQLVAKKRFNVVLLDRNLPDMDGTDVARRIRELEAGNVPAVILAVTAYCTAEDRARCLEAGMDAFVGKPLTPDKLRKALLAAGQRQLAAATTMEISAAATPREVDVQMLMYLSDGSPEGFKQQVKRFLDSLHAAEQRMRAAGSRRDYPELALAAHAIRGQARMVGGAALAQAAATLETAARSADAPQCVATSGQVGEEIQALTAAMLGHPPAARSV